jgi:endonuclease YncB( thermonuclease family)
VFIYPAIAYAELRVLDADTITFHGKIIRLSGIDSPEAAQKCESSIQTIYACGKQATEALRDLIKKMPTKKIECHYTDKDKYGRFLGECKIGDLNINMWLVENGWAVAYRQYSIKYVENEKIAQLNKSGIWSGKFIEPSKWRQGVRLYAEAKSSDSECLIKGNISSRGERIYHVLGGQDYDRTRVSPHKSERWFCSEEEALKNGWRRSKR